MRRRRIAARLIRWLGAVALIYGLFASVANRLIYYPVRYPEGDWTGSIARLRAEDRFLVTRDNVRIHAWWVESPGARIATLFLHGNAGNVTHRELHAQEITAAGTSVLLVDYRGYGRSEGSPSERGLYADADAAYDSLIAAGYTPDRIVVHGESLGTAVAADLAARRACGGVILEAPLRSLSAMAAGILPVLGPALVRGFETERKIAKIRAPLLVMQGTRDDVVPFSHGQAVFAAAPEPKWFWAVEGAHHNDLNLEAVERGYRGRLIEFYRRVIESR